jgi:dCMP deaminase
MCRISKDEYYLGIAEAVLERSTCLRRRYGAVLVKNDEIVSTGYNGSPRGEVNCCDVGYCERESRGVAKGERYELCCAIHAEDNAITSAGRDRANGGTLYIVGKECNSSGYANPQPCMMCRRKIVNAGIKRVIGLVNGKPSELDISLDSYK